MLFLLQDHLHWAGYTHIYRIKTGQKIERRKQRERDKKTRKKPMQTHKTKNMCTMLLHSCLHQAQTIHFILKTDKQKGEEEKKDRRNQERSGCKCTVSDGHKHNANTSMGSQLYLASLAWPLANVFVFKKNKIFQCIISPYRTTK